MTIYQSLVIGIIINVSRVTNQAVSLVRWVTVIDQAVCSISRVTNKTFHCEKEYY